MSDVSNDRSASMVNSLREINTQPLGMIIDTKQRKRANSMFTRYCVSGLIMLSSARARSHKSDAASERV